MRNMPQLSDSNVSVNPSGRTIAVGIEYGPPYGLPLPTSLFTMVPGVLLQVNCIVVICTLTVRVVPLESGYWTSTYAEEEVLLEPVKVDPDETATVRPTVSVTELFVQLMTLPSVNCSVEHPPIGQLDPVEYK